jgi:uncharacterized heparinase superfamily protein
MYHGMMLWSLCDLIHLADSSGIPRLIERKTAWIALFRRGLSWYSAVTHPDGEIAFFNDAAMGVAPPLDAIERYATFLQIRAETGAVPDKQPALRHLSRSGYIRIDLGEQAAAIIDVACVGPDYQPGHAHADTLSFELSLYGQRVFVNSGTSTYERGVERDAQRGTAAHNTVIVDGRNSSDTWAGFRVGRRAHPKLLAIEPTDGQIVIHAMHDGYRRLVSGATHDRTWKWKPNEVSVIDRIKGRFGHAAAHFHLHPDVEALIDTHDQRRVNLLLRGGRSATVRVSQGRVELEPSAWHPEFGQSIPSQRLVVKFTGNAIETQICWQTSA